MSPRYYVHGISDTVRRSALWGLKYGPSANGERAIISRNLRKLDVWPQDRSLLKIRPCITLVPDYVVDRRVTAGGTSGAKIRVCSMATFQGSLKPEINPEILRHFLIPVNTRSQNWDILDIDPTDMISTTPEWPARKRHAMQWIIGIPYEVNKRDLLGKWSTGVDDHGYYLAFSQYKRLVELCKEKAEQFGKLAEKSPDSYKEMRDSVMRYGY